jgi:transposase-like protein
LTITAQELGKSYCPECFESTGKKHYDFDEIHEPETEKTRYRCESCGIIIECQ